ncbi:beta-3-deoxy-D-manno-oct-2-ulosonic acid transferase [Acinetobacter sp. NIPH1876]|uniref:capsular polysaccharide export protein, LipB/KpsS family n=1 Tax=Acinetobacter sp. NIPH1876 TaxID=2924041 RepID=UPI001FAD1A14|nr:beta-3-deoxy-D-manno-oct-2-ulosonic acid transferase [Acinetobacter sp. NIPH1876]MCJ0829593.1 beta-3-deoxy-D-manno-oct-2-ulosonic acid transferase [Acinetobacter sp. NIPH1876]
MSLDEVQKKVNDISSRINVRIKKIKNDGFLKTVQKTTKELEKAKNFYDDARLSVKYYTGHIVQPYKKTAIVFNVAQWKRKYVIGFLNEYNVFFFSESMEVEQLHIAMKVTHNPVFIIWGRTTPAHLSSYAEIYNIPIYYIEDGFIRSIGLGANHVPPLSLCLDKTGLYYDSTQPSDLENILNTYDFDKDNKLIKEAEISLDFIKKYHLSKYNDTNEGLAESLYGPKTNERILVLGQVEDDQSLIYGCNVVITNVQLIKKALAENPNAQIIYKPHPDVLLGKRKELSDLSEVEDKVEIFKTPMSLADALYEVDRVYTLTSLGGFEALIYGIPVTTFGAPFYSGWGLTDDRQIISRRNRKLTLEKVFAAAYILYPRYRSSNGLEKSDLYETLTFLQDRLTDIHLSSSLSIERGMSFYNAATTHPLGLQYFAKSTDSKTVILTDKKESLMLAEKLSQYNKVVDLITIRDNLANNEDMFIKNEFADKIKLTSIHKLYSKPMSEAETQAARYARIFSTELLRILRIVTNNLVNEKILSQMSEGIEDYLYMEVLRFNGYADMLDKYDHLLAYFDSYEANKDAIDSLIYHGEKKGCFSKINLAFKNPNDTKKIIKEGISNSLDAEIKLISDYKEQFATFWWGIDHQSFKNLKSDENKVIICGNITDENYAYSPSAFRLLDVAIKQKKIKALYLNGAVLGDNLQDKIKATLLKYNYAESCEVYSGNAVNFRKKYSDIYTGAESFFSQDLVALYVHELKKQLPSEFISIVYPRIKAYLNTLLPLFVLVAEFRNLMKGTTAFLTSMERSHVSRAIVEVAREFNVKTVGIQPQVVSESARYRGSIVDLMGVIDTNQLKVYQALGSNVENLNIVGSANIIDRMLRMEEAHQAVKAEDESAIFFAMQHSLPEEMMLIGHALNNISKRCNIKLIVKPHPTQELPVLNRVKSIFDGSKNVTFLSRDSDTYLAIAKCQIVVGLFSSVLLEAAIYGKEVIVADFKDLHESVDYSKLGVAVKAQQESELEYFIKDLMKKGAEYQKLKKTRDHYLSKNPQFMAPYNNRYLDKFIIDSLN